MGRKTIFRIEHLRRLESENDAAWFSRFAVAQAFLDAKEDWPDCKFKLFQQKQDPETMQIPDFTLSCAGDRLWAIEVGITGTARTENLIDAGFEVVKVGRGRGFDFRKKLGVFRDCRKRCPYRPD